MMYSKLVKESYFPPIHPNSSLNLSKRIDRLKTKNQLIKNSMNNIKGNEPKVDDLTIMQNGSENNSKEKLDVIDYIKKRLAKLSIWHFIILQLIPSPFNII